MNRRRGRVCRIAVDGVPMDGVECGGARFTVLPITNAEIECGRRRQRGLMMLPQICLFVHISMRWRRRER